MNKIKEIMKMRGIEMFQPTEELLKELGMDAERLKRITSNRAKMKPLEIVKVCEWLKIPVDELITE